MYGIKTVVFRHSSMYGGRQFATYDQGWIGWFVQQCLKQAEGNSLTPFTVSGNGKQVRDVLHADDMKSLYRAALTKADRCAGEVFNIGGGMQNSLSIIELMQQLGDILDFKPLFSHIEPRRSDQKIFIADTSKAHCLLEWQPTVSTIMGFEKMLHWSREIPSS